MSAGVASRMNGEFQLAQDGTGMAERLRAAGDAARRKAEQVRTWFFSPAPSAAVAWFVLAFALLAVLAWFFLCSPYGAPAAPVYAEF